MVPAVLAEPVCCPRGCGAELCPGLPACCWLPVLLPCCRIGAGNAVPSRPRAAQGLGAELAAEGRGARAADPITAPLAGADESQQCPGCCALWSPRDGDRDAALPRAAVSGAGPVFGHRESKRGGAAAPSHPTARSQAPLARIAFAMTATAAPALPCGAASAELGLAPCPAGCPGPALPTATLRCPGGTWPNPLNSAHRVLPSSLCTDPIRGMTWGLRVAAGGHGGEV